jgi:hypothetical protein
MNKNNNQIKLAKIMMIFSRMIKLQMKLDRKNQDRKQESRDINEE